MTGYLLRRVLALVPVLLGISLLAYGLANLAPGDPARIQLRHQLGEPPSEEAVGALRRELGLDDPFALRYARWVGRALRGDLGVSYRTGEPVLGALAGRFPATLQIALAAVALGLVAGIPAGVVSAVRRNSPLDHASRLTALIGASMPSFWLGYVLIAVFAVGLGVLPVAGRGGVGHLVLPAATLGLGAAAGLSRLVRSGVLEVLGEDHVRTARAKGLTEARVLRRHVLRNALIPVVTLAGIRFGHLLGGAVIVETVFAWPGIGKYVVDSIYDRDYPTIQGFVVFIATVFVILNILVDLAYLWLDPRIRLAGGEHPRGR